MVNFRVLGDSLLHAGLAVTLSKHSSRREHIGGVACDLLQPFPPYSKALFCVLMLSDSHQHHSMSPTEVDKPNASNLSHRSFLYASQGGSSHCPKTQEGRIDTIYGICCLELTSVVLVHSIIIQLLDLLPYSNEFLY